jgi:hypothetical protein
VCCDDGEHCCPSDHTCDSKKRVCIKKDGTIAEGFFSAFLMETRAQRGGELRR